MKFIIFVLYKTLFFSGGTNKERSAIKCFKNCANDSGNRRCYLLQKSIMIKKIRKNW
jgi:hypothetical protein